VEECLIIPKIVNIKIRISYVYVWSALYNRR
jgi:hypothetical protein